MATINCFLTKKPQELEKATKLAESKGFCFEDLDNIKFDDAKGLEKLLANYISYEVRFYHPSEKKYKRQRFKTGLKGRNRAIAEKEQIEKLIEAKAVGAMKKDYPILKIFQDYIDKPPSGNSAKTINRYKQYCAHFQKFFKNVCKPKIKKVSQLSPGLIVQYIEMRKAEVLHTRKKPPTNKCIKQEIQFLFARIRRLRQLTVIDELPIEDFPYEDFLSSKEKKGGSAKKVSKNAVLTEPEYQKLIDLCKTRKSWAWLANPLEFMKYTGKRESDITFLQVEDVDFDKMVIKFVEKEITYDTDRNKNVKEEYRPKSTGKEVQEVVIPLAKKLKPMLLKLCDEAKKHKDRCVFRNSRNNKITKSGLRKMFSTLTAKIGRPDVTKFHSTRNLFIAKAFATGDPQTAKGIVGHKYLQTSDEYMDFINLEKQRDLIDSIEYDEEKPTRITDKRMVTYILNGELKPNDREICPSCLCDWKNKLFQNECSCGVMIRRDLKVYSPERFCMNCDSGFVDNKELTCSECEAYHDEAFYIRSKGDFLKLIQ